MTTTAWSRRLRAGFATVVTGATMLVAVPAHAETADVAVVDTFPADLPGTAVSSVVQDRPVAAHGAAGLGASSLVGADLLRDELGLTGRALTGLASQGAVVAVIDSGIDGSHPAFSGTTIRAFVDFVGPVAQCPAPGLGAYDDAGHGTHVASVIAGHGGDVSGVAPAAGLVGLKVLDCNGQGITSDVIEALAWVRDNRVAYGIDAVNLSLGDNVASDGNDPLSRAVNQVVAAGVVVVLSAGNAGSGRGTVGSPGSAAWGLTVGAVADATAGGTYLAGFSGRGPTVDGRIKPDLVAPGVQILGAQAGGGTAVSSGTSMASPVVAAVAAVLVEADPSLRPSGTACASCASGVQSMSNPIADLLRATAEDHGAVGPDVDFGHGLLDARAAAVEALGSTLSPRNAPCTASTRVTVNGVREVAFTAAQNGFGIAGTILGDAPFSAELTAPNGQVFPMASGSTRQVAFVVEPAPAGTYVLALTAAGTSLVVDVSGAADIDGAPGRCPTKPSTPTASSVGLPAPCTGEGGVSRFADVSVDSAHSLGIECIAAVGVTAGRADGTFGPEGDVSRAQLATFLVRLLAEGGHVLPAGPDAFPDDDGSVHEANINALAAAGIVGGRANGTYDPAGLVSRAQMATFLLRTHDLVAGATVPSGTDHFVDDNGTALEANINRIADLGIMEGAGAGTFGGAAPVLRGPMATYLTRILLLAAEG